MKKIKVIIESILEWLSNASKIDWIVGMIVFLIVLGIIQLMKFIIFIFFK